MSGIVKTLLYAIGNAIRATMLMTHLYYYIVIHFKVIEIGISQVVFLLHRLVLIIYIYILKNVISLENFFLLTDSCIARSFVGC